MSEFRSLPAQPLCDPVGRSPARTTELASRPASISGARVLLFDNGKLSPAYGNFLATFDEIATALRAAAEDVQIDRLSVDLLGAGSDPVERAFRYAAAQEPRAAVLALADSGVTQRTVELARRWEEAGVACCILSTEPGTGLARAIAAAQVPGLPIIDLEVLRGHSRAEVAERTRRRLPDILGALTKSVAELWTEAARNAVAPEPSWSSATDDLLQMPALSVSAGSAADPNFWPEHLANLLGEAGLGDGLPVVLPTEGRVAGMLETVGRAGEEVLLPSLIPSGAPVTVAKLAANAVLAGCRPEYFPVVLTAFEAMTDPRYRLQQAAITSHPSGNLLMVSGPAADRIGISSGAGCLGPGHRANLTIGRALTLTLINVGRIRPGQADLAGFGSAAEVAYCFGENRVASPWPTFAEENYGSEASCVLVHRCEAPHNVIDHLSTTPESLLTGIASVAATLGANNAYQPAELVVLLNPEHVQLITAAGWTKRDIQLFLWDEARNAAADLAGRGLPPSRRPAQSRGEWIPVVNDPDEIIVVVAGGPGPQSMVAIPWGFARAVHRPLSLPSE